MTVEHRFYRRCCGIDIALDHAEWCVTLRSAAVQEALGHVESARAEIKAGDDNAAGGHLEMAARALVYHNALDDLRDAIEASNRACDATVEGWPALAADLTNEAHDRLVRWLLADVGRELDAPEFCECDQVQRLREELDDARADWRHERRRREAAMAKWSEERDKLQRRLDEALAERDGAREALQRATDHAFEVEAERDAALQWGRDGARWSCERAQERDALQGLIRRCLDKIPRDIDHGGDLEKAVDRLLFMVAQTSSAAAALARVAWSSAPDPGQEEWIPGHAMTQELLDRHPRWESNQYSPERRTVLHGRALDLRTIQRLPYSWRPVPITPREPALIRALRFAVNASADEAGLSDEERNALAKMVRGGRL